MTEKPVTALSSAQFVHLVNGQSHAMAGAVIALSSAQAVALGHACVQISAHLADDSEEFIGDPANHLYQNQEALLKLCDQDAGAIAEFVALREAGKTLEGQQLLCHIPSEISRLSFESANILQNFRRHVNDRVQDDLEMSISLLAGTAQAAMLLLDSNLRIWPEKALTAKFGPIQEELELGIKRLSPVNRIRQMD